MGILSLISSVIVSCYENLLEDRLDLSEELRQIESESWEFRNVVCRAVDTSEGISTFWLYYEQGCISPTMAILPGAGYIEQSVSWHRWMKLANGVGDSQESQQSLDEIGRNADGVDQDHQDNGSASPFSFCEYMQSNFGVSFKDDLFLTTFGLTIDGDDPTEEYSDMVSDTETQWSNRSVEHSVVQLD